MLNDRSVQRAVAKLLISATTEAGAPERLWWEVEDVVHARRPAGVDAAALLASVAGHGGEWFAERRGAKYGWTYETTDEVAAAAIDVLLAVARSHPSDALAEAARRFAAAYVSATRRTFDPYPSCSRVCPDGTCRFRHAVEELIGDGSWDASWKDADLADAAAQSKTTTWTLCQDAAFELVEWTDPTQSAEVRAVVAADACRGALCFAQQMIVRDHRNPPRGQRVGMERILAEAQR